MLKLTCPCSKELSLIILVFSFCLILTLVMFHFILYLFLKDISCLQITLHIYSIEKSLVIIFN